MPFQIGPVSAIIGGVGSGGIRRRKRRQRLRPPDLQSEADWPGWDAPGSQYTFEGYLRSLRRFLLGRRRAEGWRRHLATGLIWLILGPLLAVVLFSVVGVIIAATTAIWRLVGS